MSRRRDAKKQRSGPFRRTDSASVRYKLLFLRVSASLRWLVLLTLANCGVPNLEPPECASARTAVREFYSLHFANEMGFSEEGLKQRARFLSPALIEQAGKASDGTDPFTTGDTDFPKAFRAGECRVISPDRTLFDVLLFWKDNVRSEQRTIRVEAIKRGDTWLVDKIEL